MPGAVGEFGRRRKPDAQHDDRRNRRRLRYASSANRHPAPDTRYLVIRSTAALLALTAGGLIKFIAFIFGPVLLTADRDAG